MKKFVALLACVMTVLLGSTALARTPKHVKKFVVNGERLIVLDGGVESSGAKAIVQRLVKLDNESDETIIIILKSPGGGVVAGFGIIAAMRATDAPITCVVDGYAFSMAALILQYCDLKGAQIYSRIMFHQASYQIGGNESLVGSRYKHAQGWLYSLHKDVAKQMNIKFGTYRRLIANEWWLTAEGARRVGVVDFTIGGLKYEYEVPSTSGGWGFIDENKYEGDFMMCGPTIETDDPCYGIYR